ncbi:hypothetical protein DPMN_170035 [Dreissena polymorpha]|uniref:Uncharacterized protein n=1 Tax=Dreissena polymorpha TaxID=45954 RepID=A0A9D4DVN8_DREPO|nr:hypothetical protein DPMN_170035 [Dreissena polymorpha]
MASPRTVPRRYRRGRSRWAPNRPEQSTSMPWKSTPRRHSQTAKAKSLWDCEPTHRISCPANPPARIWAETSPAGHPEKHKKVIMARMGD